MNRILPLQGSPPDAPVPLALARKGFRPFFLLAMTFACTIVPAWLLVVFGRVHPGTYLDAPSWHAHEMIFGYAVAVIAGFLLTAVGNWTGRETVVGGKLLGLAGAWVLGRIVMATPASFPRGIAAFVDLAFLPLLGLALAWPLLATKNRRNVVMLGILVALFATNVIVHLEALGHGMAGSGRRALLVAIDVIVLLCTVMAGRVLPMFTRNATGAANVASSPGLETMSGLAMVAVVLSDGAVPGSRAAAAIAGVAGILLLARAARWGTLRTSRTPLLWILHAGYGWIAIGLLLRAAPLAGLVIPDSLATHALTLGAIGSLTIGMMARVALGHTGRALVDTPPTTAAFVLVTLAAVVRVGVPLLWPAAYATTLLIAGAAWTAAFAIVAVAYLPILVTPRVDAKPG